MTTRPSHCPQCGAIEHNARYSPWTWICESREGEHSKKCLMNQLTTLRAENTRLAAQVEGLRSAIAEFLGQTEVHGRGIRLLQHLSWSIQRPLGYLQKALAAENVTGEAIDSGE